MSRLLAGRQDGTVAVWDAHAPNLGLVELTTLYAHTSKRPRRETGTEAVDEAGGLDNTAPGRQAASVTALMWLVDGEKLVTGAADGTISVWTLSLDGTLDAGSATFHKV